MGRTILKLDIDEFMQPLLYKLKRIDGNVEEAVTNALEQAAETISEDTLEALDVAMLPAQGKYSTGKTKNAVVSDTRVQREGDVLWVPVGFNFSMPGAGGFLITGTPRMRPDRKLHAMYKQKKYMRWIQAGMWDVVSDYVTGARS